MGMWRRAGLDSAGQKTRPAAVTSKGATPEASDLDLQILSAISQEFDGDGVGYSPLMEMRHMKITEGARVWVRTPAGQLAVPGWSSSPSILPPRPPQPPPRRCANFSRAFSTGSPQILQSPPEPLHTCFPADSFSSRVFPTTPKFRNRVTFSGCFWGSVSHGNVCAGGVRSGKQYPILMLAGATPALEKRLGVGPEWR